MSDIVERLRASAPLPICPYDRRAPVYAPNDQPCSVCGGLPEGPDKCTGADTRLFTEAATAIEARDAEIARLQAQNEAGVRALGVLAALETRDGPHSKTGVYTIKRRDIRLARAALKVSP